MHRDAVRALQQTNEFNLFGDGEIVVDFIELGDKEEISGCELSAAEGDGARDISIWSSIA